MRALCEAPDVADVLGRDLTSSEARRWKPIAIKATALFREASGQHFTPGRSTVDVQVLDQRLTLEQRPVAAVHSIVDRHGQPVSWERLRGQRLEVPGRHSAEFLTVDYSHGDATVPDLVRTTIAEIVMKVLTIDPNAAAGRVQYSRTAGPYTEMATYAAWAQGGQTMLSPNDEQIAHSLRTRRPRVHVMRP